MSFSFTVLALGIEVGSSVLLIHLYLLGEGDSNLLGEVFVAGGAFDGHEPGVVLGDCD